MEIMIQWFWLVKLLVASIIISVAYIAFFKKKFESKFWNILAFVLIILAIINPVKLEPESKSLNTSMNRFIENGKVLPDKKEDNSFREKVESVQGIKEEDLK